MSAKSNGKSNIIINIAVWSVAVSVAVMLISVAVVKGYQLQITNKITGFSNHIQLSQLDFNNSFETNPIKRDTALELVCKKNAAIKFIQPFVVKAGIVKTNNEVEGIVLKGVDDTYSWSFLQSHLVQGAIPGFKTSATSQEIVISNGLAKKLKIKQGQALIMYFIQNNNALPRARKFTVCGIFDTGFEEIDNLYALVDMRQLQKLNNWEVNQVSGYEISIANFNEMAEVSIWLFNHVPYQFQVKQITEIYPQLFDWLGLLNINVVVIIILMVVVACINMCTALLILIVERTNMIGIFKAIGAGNKLIQFIFVHIAARLIFKGLLWGNVIGLTICLSQHYWGWIKLNQEAYFLNQVPIYLTVTDIVLVNITAFGICTLLMLLPARFVVKISPAKAIKFQ